MISEQCPGVVARGQKAWIATQCGYGRQISPLFYLLY